MYLLFLLQFAQLLSLCVALPKVFSAEEYAGGCLGMVQSTYIWKDCMGLNYTATRLCTAKLPAVLKTSVSCIDQLMANVSDSVREQKRLDTYNSLVLQCEAPNVTLALIESYSKSSDDLKPFQGERDMALAGTWNASTAFKPTAWECEKAVIAYFASDQMIPRGLRACSATMAYWGGVVFIRFVVHWLSTLFPRSTRAANTAVARFCRKWFTLPAVFRSKHSQAAMITRYFPLNFPTREQSLIITGFVALHLGLTFGYTTYYPYSYIFNYDNVYWYNQCLAFRTGKMAVFELPLAILFAGRNNFLQWLTGWPHDTFVVYHKWLARCIGFSILTHSIAYTVAYIRGHYYSMMWSVAYWKWGVAGTFGCCMIIFQGMAAIRRLHYEIFLILHILLALLFIIGGYYHLKKMEEQLEYFYATFAVWGFDRAARLARVLFSNPFAKAEVKLYDDDMLEFTIAYSRLWKLRPGDYAFIHILQPTFFWESHPFTLSMGVRSGEEDKLKIFGRVKDGMTRRTMRRAMKSGGSFTTRVWIDGPYGPSYSFKHFDEALFLAGGIGVTAPFSYIQGILQNPKSRTSRISLYWAVSDDRALIWFKDQLEYLKQSGRVEVRVFMGYHNVDPVLEQERIPVSDDELRTGGTVIEEFTASHPSPALSSGDDVSSVEKRQKTYASSSVESLVTTSTCRLDARSIVKNAIEEAKGSLGVLCCGPAGINDDTRFAVANGLHLSPHYVEYFEESFSW